MNFPIVTVKQFTEIVKLSFSEGIMRPIFGLGKGGIGKTESIEDLAKKELKIGYVDVRLLLFSEVDLKGIPYPDEDKVHTVWLQNKILPMVERDGERGILVFDEITSAARSVRTAVYQLLNERRLGEYKLPEGWLVVCLGNGEEDGGDYNGMEGNFINRCSVFRVEPDFDAWREWAINASVHPLVIAYLVFAKHHLHTFVSDDTEGSMLFASPRSWKATSDILGKKEYNYRDHITNLRINSNIGSEVGMQFTSFCKYQDSMVDPEKILSGEKVSHPTDVEAILISIQSVVKSMIELVKSDTRNGEKVKTPTLQKWAHGIRWIMKVKSLEHAIMAIKDCIIFAPDVVPNQILISPEFDRLCPEFGDFAVEHSHIMKV